MSKLLYKISLIGLAVILTGQGCVSFSNKNNNLTGSAGMFVSVDKGDSWQQISLLPQSEGVKNISNINVYKLFADPQDSAALYWATRENGFLYSYDEGRSWQQPKGDLAKGFVYSISVHPKNKCIIYVSSGDKILKTEDCSRSWVEVYRESRPDVKVTSLVLNPSAPHQVFAAEENGDLIESIDEGRSWHSIERFKEEISDIYADPLQSDVLYVASRRKGLYRSLNAGKTWESLSDSMKDFSGALEYRRFLVHPKVSGRLYWISTYGILLSTDSGNTWNPIDLITPPGSAQIYGFSVNQNNVDEIYYTATINNRSTFYKSEDGGLRWITKRMPSGQLPTTLYVHPEKDEILYMGFTKLPKN